MFKPDYTAEGRAVEIARQANPAADQNAQSIVIHSLHRPGAPGIAPAAPRPRSPPEETSHEIRPVGPLGRPAEPRRARRLPAARGRRDRPADAPVVAQGGRPRDPARRPVRRDHAGSRARRSSTTTPRGARSTCPRRWARARPSSTPTATATPTSSSSTRRTGTGRRPARPQADPRLLPERRQGALRRRHRRVGPGADVVRDGRGRGRLRQRRRPRPVRHLARRLQRSSGTTARGTSPT